MQDAYNPLFLPKETKVHHNTSSTEEIKPFPVELEVRMLVIDEIHSLLAGLGTNPVAGRVPCQFCGAILSDDLPPKGGPNSHTILEFERAYQTALLGAAPRIPTLHGVSGEQFRRFVDDTTRLVVNAMDEEPAARLDTRRPSPGASRQKVMGTV